VAINDERRAQLLAMKPEDLAALAALIRRSRDAIPAQIAQLQRQQTELTAWLEEFDPDEPARCRACRSTDPAVRNYAGGYPCDDPSGFHKEGR
jgi:hypothetical protein